jgi:hypothetical protein
MDKGLYSKVLNALYDEGIGSEMDVWPVFDGFFVEPVDIGQAMYSYRYESFNPILMQLVNNKHIIYKPEVNPLLGHKERETWYSHHPVIASITPEGYEFYDRYLINQSVFGLNGTLKTANEKLADNSDKQTDIFNGQLKIYRGQFWLLGLTTLFSVVSLVLGILTYKATVSASNVSDKVDALKQTIFEQNRQINTLQTDLLKAKTKQNK